MPYPAKKTPELIQTVLDAVSSGIPLEHVCKAQGITVQSWHVWRRADEELAIAHGRARDDGFDALAAESLAIIDAPPERVVTMSGEDRVESRIDSASVQWAKNRAEHRLKLLAKWDPRRYGDKIELEHKGGVKMLRVDALDEDL